MVVIILIVLFIITFFIYLFKFFQNNFRLKEPVRPGAKFKLQM